MKPKLLCILHRSPPVHGAAKVGDFIASMPKMNDHFECKFITIKSSNTIGDIGKVNLKKIFYALNLYRQILFALISFRPNKIYFTASFQSVAFFRDLIACCTWKFFNLFLDIDIYFHYHTKGIDKFVSRSKTNLILTQFFLKNVNLILLSPILKNDFDKIKSFKNIYYLPNSVESPALENDFKEYLDQKLSNIEKVQTLYLAHMIKEKGYWEVLELARQSKSKNIIFNFAGSWQDKKSETEFFQYIAEHNLEEQVVFHGYVSGSKKATLFKDCHILLYPSKNDAFPLTLLESLSYGVPVITTNEGSIPSIIDKQCGFVLDDITHLKESLDNATSTLINSSTSLYCYNRYLKYYSMTRFEDNFLEILNA